MELLVKRLHPDAEPPRRMLGAAVGYDLTAYLKQAEGRPTRAIIPPHNVRSIPTGVCCTLQGPPIKDLRTVIYLQIMSRSGLAKRGLFVANAPGIIDPDYTGEIVVLLLNSGYETQYISHGDRIAQLVYVVGGYPQVREVAEFSSNTTVRGAAGLGSTGT